jgi:hypothetical protein
MASWSLEAKPRTSVARYEFAQLSLFPERQINCLQTWIQGYFVEPTIFKNVNEDAEIYREEIFGPVLLVNTFKTEEDVIRRANDTEYGLFGKSFSFPYEGARTKSILIQVLTHLYSLSLHQELRACDAICKVA